MPDCLELKVMNDRGEAIAIHCPTFAETIEFKSHFSFRNGLFQSTCSGL